MSSIKEAIGNTPLVRLSRIGRAVDTVIAAKLEYLNPSGSHKDRIYLRMLQEAEKSGALRPGMTIIECSTGNAGIACSMIGRLMGYPVTIVMPEGMSEERKQMIRAFGANIIFSPGAESDQDLSMRMIESMVWEQPGKYYYPNQFSNRDNLLAHYYTTGPEIWRQTDGKVDAVVAAIGSGATLCGVAGFLKTMKPDVKVFGVEPAECAILSGGGWGSHEIQGIGDGFVPDNLDLDLLDGVVQVSSEEAIQMARLLALEEGILAGVSSGCNVAASLKVAKAVPTLSMIVTTINDSGQRYFSTRLWGGEQRPVEIPERDHRLPPEVAGRLESLRKRWRIIR